MKLFLVSAAYSSNKLATNLIFYNPENNSLFTITDPYNHKPYCYVRPDYEYIVKSITEETHEFELEYKIMTDCIADRKIKMVKVTSDSPLSIGGANDSLRNKMVTWESNIKYYERYLFDNQFICGMWYEVNDGIIKPYYHDVDYTEVSNRLKLGDNDVYNEFVNYWVGLLNQPIPNINRLAVDIEVEFDGDKFPSVSDPQQKITAIGFSSNDGLRRVLVLDEKGIYTNTDTSIYYKDEKQLILDGLKLIAGYPFIVTFNGDAFDLPYLYARANTIGVDRDDIPLTIKSLRMSNGAYVDPVYVKNAIHLDLYRFFKNRSVQNYAFSHKYNEFSLDAISKGILNEEKIKYVGSINDMPPDKLGEYCLNDADLTIKLTTFNDNLLVKLMIMISRISKQPIDDICRYGINQWGRGMIYSEMIKRNMLIPRTDELLGKGFTASQSAIIKEKKYKGAFVFEPTKGTYFDVYVLDFACFDDQTEVLTDRGWQTINTIKEGEPCLSVNIKTGNVEHDIINRVYKYDYNGELLHIKTPKKLDFLFTDNHRMVYKRKKGGYKSGFRDELEVKPLKDISYYHYALPYFGKWIGRSEESTLTLDSFRFKTDDFFEFLGRFLGDGYINKRSVKITTNVKYRDRIDNLINIIKNMGLNPTIYRYKDHNAVDIIINNTLFVNSLKKLFNDHIHSKDRCIPNIYKDYNITHLNYLFKGLMESDGSKYDSGELVYTSINKQLAEDFQLLALKCGYNCHINRRGFNGYGDKVTYAYICTLSGFRRRQASFVVSKQYNHTSKKYYKGKVWCASTNNSTLIIRRNGRVIVTGNSLYPSIVKTYNISFETVKCSHQGCMNNIIPETNSWGCKRKQGITSLIIGSLRDLRVSYYKYMSKKEGVSDEEHQLYDIVAQTLKVILNASYGIMGFESFPLYCLPVAEAVTAYGRHIIGQTINKAEELGLRVVYGDTDSIFVHGINDDNIKAIIQWTSKNFGIDLEAEKHYRYLIMSDRKKNYLGITDNGKPDIKGLTGKKSHTPVFIREMFFSMLDILKSVNTEDDLDRAKQSIGNMIKQEVNKLRDGKLSLDKLAYNIVVNKDVESYGTIVIDENALDLDGNRTISAYKGIPQHIKAAKMLSNVGVGTVVSIVKTNDNVGVKPANMIKSFAEIDVKKYISLLQNTFEQVLDSFDMDFNELITTQRQSTLRDFFFD